MITLTEVVKEQMFSDAKNLWFSALFENIPASLPNITFEVQNEPSRDCRRPKTLRQYSYEKQTIPNRS